MKVFFDDQIFYMQNFGGISRYFAEIINGLNKKAGVKSIPRKFFSNNIHLAEKGLASYSFLRTFNFSKRGRVRNHIYSLQVSKTLKFLQEGEFDVFHPTYYDSTFVDYIQPKKPFVITVHDMIHELYYDKQSQREHFETVNKRRLLPIASHIIAVSQNTKKDILKIFPEIDASKITVAYHGQSLFGSSHTNSSNVALPEKFILFVGKRETYKNFLWFINAVSGLLRGKDVFVVCAGGGSFTADEERALDKQHIRHKVIFVDIKDDKELSTIYRKAVCFVFPSLYEGFGIPILEAFACGCPVILSNSSSFPEVGGNAALYFELEDPETLMKAIKKVLQDVELSENLKKAGYERLKPFSWDKSVRQHQEVYKMLLN
jgi:glycosyltransferase involved in cell wall biosynthesis